MASSSRENNQSMKINGNAASGMAKVCVGKMAYQWRRGE